MIEWRICSGPAPLPLLTTWWESRETVLRELGPLLV